MDNATSIKNLRNFIKGLGGLFNRHLLIWQILIFIPKSGEPMRTYLYIAVNWFTFRFLQIKWPINSSIHILYVEQMIDNCCEFFGGLRFQDEFIGEAITPETLEQLELLEVALTRWRNKARVFVADLFILNVVAASSFCRGIAVPQTWRSSNLLSLGNVTDFILIIPFDVLFGYCKFSTWAFLTIFAAECFQNLDLIIFIISRKFHRISFILPVRDVFISR